MDRPSPTWTERLRGGDFLGRVMLVVLVVALALLAWAWRHVLLLLFGSVLIAIGLHGLAKPIAQRTGLSKGWALLLATVLVIAVLTGIGWLFGSQIGAQVTELQQRLPQALDALRTWLDTTRIGAVAASQIESLRSGGGGVTSALARAGGWTLTFASAALDTLVVLFAAAFLAAEPAPYRNGVLNMFPRGLREEVGGAMDDTAHALKKWLLGTLVSMTSITIMVGVALWLLGVPAFFALALIAGLAQFVPLVGPVIAAGPGVLLALTVGVDTALWTGVVYLAASQIEANLIYPVIQKRAVSLPPALTLFSILAMGLLLGPLGVVFAVPLTVVISIVVVRLYMNRVLHEDVVVPGR